MMTRPNHRLASRPMMQFSPKCLTSILLAAFLCILGGQQVFATPKTEVILDSTRGDYVGSGRLWSYTPANATIFVQPAPSISGVWIHISQNNSQIAWDLLFSAPHRENFRRGQYEGARRIPFNSPTQAGIDVSGSSRGCNRVSGRFLVSEFVLDSSGNVQRLAVDFEQLCDFSVAPMYGSVRFNSAVSTVPRVSVGNATTLKGIAGESDALAVVSLSKPSTRIQSVYFTTVDDTARRGIDYVRKSGVVVFQPDETAKLISVPIIGDLVARGNRAFTVELSQKDGTAIGDGKARVNILDPHSPMTVLAINSQPQDFVGSGLSWLETAATAKFDGYRHFENWVRIWTSHPHNWSLWFAAPNNGVLLPGIYKSAVRFPAPPGLPGLTVIGRGRGCNTLTGNFVVHQADFHPNGKVKNFSADFVQHCEGLKSALFGSIRINSKLRQASVTNAVILGSTAVFTVTLSSAGNKPEFVKFKTVNGSAIAGVDFAAVSQTVTFSPGEIKKTVVVPLFGGATAGKRFFGTLSANAMPLWIRVGSATIK